MTKVQYHKQLVLGKRRLLDIEKNKPCTDCKNKFPSVCMDFDHVRGHKVAGVSKLLARSWEVIKQEIAKCDLVCANCHRIRTMTRARTPYQRRKASHRSRAWQRFNMKNILNVYTLRDGVFVLGRAGEKAKAVCTWNKKKNAYVGIRGVKPTIPAEAKRVGASKAVRARLQELAA